jgi:hypothetical protein
MPKSKPSPVGAPKNPEVPSLTVQKEKKSETIEKPADKKLLRDKMFGADD